MISICKQKYAYLKPRRHRKMAENNNNGKKRESTESDRRLAKTWRKEKLWSILKERVFEPPFCKTIDQLVARVHKAWTDIPEEIFAGIVHRNWSKRVSEVIDHQGENNFS